MKLLIGVAVVVVLVITVAIFMSSRAEDPRIVSLKSEVGNIDSQKKTLEAELGKLKAERDSEVSRLNSLIAERDRQIKLLGDDVSNSTSKMTILNQQISGFENENNSLRSENDKLRNELQLAGQKSQELSKNIDGLNLQIKLLNDSIAGKNNEIKKYVEIIGRFEREIIALQNHIQALAQVSTAYTGGLRWFGKGESKPFISDCVVVDKDFPMGIGFEKDSSGIKDIEVQCMYGIANRPKYSNKKVCELGIDRVYIKEENGLIVDVVPQCISGDNIEESLGGDYTSFSCPVMHRIAGIVGSKVGGHVDNMAFLCAPNM